jgi:type I restriction enzyme S subunit
MGARRAVEGGGVNEAVKRGAVTGLRRFKPYPSYKDSGVEWLGEIPAHWEAVRSKRLFTLRNVRAHPEDIQLTASQQHGVIPQTEFMAREGRRVVQVLTGADILKRVEANDFVISMRSFQGGIEWSRYSGAISSAYVVLAPSASVWHPFFFYLLKSKHYIQALQSTSDLVRDGQALRYENFTQVALLFVPFDEQRTIGAFLDRETARVDALVAKKERLMQLLQEKRTGLITRAVTKGLDPTVPMKGSGVEWLGEIPAHWEVRRLKDIVPAITVGIVVTPAKYYVDEGVPCLRSLNITRGHIDLTDIVFISPWANDLHRKSKIFVGDVIVVRTGKAGTAVVVPPELDGANCIDLLIIRRSGMLDSRFLYYFINSPATLAQVEAHSVGAIQEHYNTATLAELQVPGVPLAEQRAIAAFLDRETAKLDTLMAKVRHAIDLLKELRATLISAAVTGKIDVRQEAA